MVRWTLALGVVLALVACGEGGSPPSSSEGDLLRALGARGRAGVPQDQLEAYASTFGFLDADGNGLISLEEYEANSIFANSISARGVFGATDRDGSGGVTVEEYVENRIITDEAKAIHQAIDEDGSGGVSPAEMQKRVQWSPEELDEVFTQFDLDGDGEIVQIEWLRTWGDWARRPGAGLV